MKREHAGLRSSQSLQLRCSLLENGGIRNQLLQCFAGWKSCIAYCQLPTIYECELMAWKIEGESCRTNLKQKEDTNIQTFKQKELTKEILPARSKSIFMLCSSYEKVWNRRDNNKNISTQKESNRIKASGVYSLMWGSPGSPCSISSVICRI